jgi:RNA polymerase sigma factor (sigma-70 family)
MVLSLLLMSKTQINEYSDELLWLQVKVSDKLAFERLLAKFYQPLFQYGSKLTTDIELTKDCLQDLFLDIWEKRKKINEVDCVKAYLFMAFRNNLRRRIKKEMFLGELSDKNDFSDESLSPELSYILEETQNWESTKLKKTISLLPERQKEALYLRFYEGLSYDEIAEIMQLNHQAVANYIHYALQKLRNYWVKVISVALVFLFS